MQRVGVAASIIDTPAGGRGKFEAMASSRPITFTSTKRGTKGTATRNKELLSCVLRLGPF